MRRLIRPIRIIKKLRSIKSSHSRSLSLLLALTIFSLFLQIAADNNLLNQTQPFNLNKAYSEMSSDNNWSIQIDDIGINSNPPAPGTQKQQLPNQKTPKKPPDIDTNETTSMTLSISNSLIDYGILSATNPVYRTTNVSLSGGTKSSIVLEYQNNPLSTDNAATIPDTSCDNGSCSEFTPALWENTLTYGFGYRCENVNGEICPGDFKIKDYYKQFSDSTKQEEPQIIMSKNNSENPEVQILYKVNISKSQTQASYTNTVTYIAVPGY